MISKQIPLFFPRSFSSWCNIVVLAFVLSSMSWTWADKGQEWFQFPQNMLVLFKDQQTINEFVAEANLNFSNLITTLYLQATEKSHIDQLVSDWATNCGSVISANKKINATATLKLLKKSQDWPQISPWFKNLNAGFIKLQAALPAVRNEAEMEVRLVNYKIANAKNIRIIALWEKEIKRIDQSIEDCQIAIRTKNPIVIRETLANAEKIRKLTILMHKVAYQDQQMVKSCATQLKSELVKWESAANQFNEINIPDFQEFANKAEEFKAHLQTQYGKIIESDKLWWSIIAPVITSSILKQTRHMQSWNIMDLEKKYFEIYQELKKLAK